MRRRQGYYCNKQQWQCRPKKSKNSAGCKKPNSHPSVPIFALLLQMCSCLYTGSPPASLPPLPHANTAPSECCVWSRDVWSTQNTTAQETEKRQSITVIKANVMFCQSMIEGTFSNWPGFLLVHDMGTWSAVSHPHCFLQHPDMSLCPHFSPTEKEEGRGKQWKETKWKTNIQCKLFKQL